MNRNESIKLREERRVIANQMSELATGGLKTAEDRTRFDAMDAAQKELKERIDRIEAASGVAEEMRSTGRPPNGQPGDEPAEGTPEAEKVRTEKDRQVFRSYLKFGSREEGGAVGRMTTEDRGAFLKRFMKTSLSEKEMRDIAKLIGREFRDMGTSGQGAYPGITSGAGIFVPVGFVDRITEALKYYGPMLTGGEDMPDIMETATGQPLPFPTDNDTTVTGEIIGEAQQVTTADITIGQVILGAYKFSTRLVKVSIELLQDSAFDIEAYLIKKFAIRTGRILNTKFTIGSGVNEPYGLVTQSVLGATAVGTSSNDGTAAGTNTIGSDDMTSLEHSVDPLYRMMARYMFHDSTLKSLKQVKDKYGRPLWLPSVQVNAPDTINGYKYAINNDMDTLQTQSTSPPVTKKTVLFGHLPLYQIRRVKEMSVLRLEERFGDFGQIAFLGFSRYDANLLDAGTHPVKYLANVY